MVNQRLLQQRNNSKRRKPPFVQRESNFTAGVKARWRYPQGRHSAIRQVHRGRQPMPTPGYGSPKAVKGLHPSGLEIVLIHTIPELEKINAAVQGVVIANSVGMKKRLSLLQLAQAKKITVFNRRHLVEEISVIEKNLKDRHEVKKLRQQRKEKKESEKKKKAEEKKKQEQEVSVPEKKEETVEDKVAKDEKQIKEMEKVVIKKQ